METATKIQSESRTKPKDDDWICHPHPVDDWTDLCAGQSPGTKRWLYFKRKYFIERMIGCLLLVPAYPFILLLCLLVRLSSPGGGFYKHTRVGYRGRHFEIIKIRTMRMDAEADGQARWCEKGDPRITTFGRVIRKLHLDELPQLINVARGEMTLVGPRPERPVFVEKLKLEIPGYERRLSVMPGITGLAQINLPPDVCVEDVRRKQSLDLLYIEQAGFWLDFRMLLATSVRLIGVPGAILTSCLGLYRKVPVSLLNAEAVASSVSIQNPVRRLDRVRSSRSSQRVQFAPADARAASSSRPALDDSIPNALTVDVEDYFQVSAFEHRVSRDDWKSYESRVEANTIKLLQLFEENRVRGTFFILGWVAERFPDLIRRIANAGHELGCHSFYHRLVYDMTPGEFREDLIMSRDAIQHACGIVVKCYRAPSFSITARSLWAISTLIDEGFTVDSSIFPMKHDRYGMPSAPSEVHYHSTPNSELIEFPPSVWRSPLGKIPIGGGYFRLAPLWLTQRAIDGVRKAGCPAMFYVHPWEIDPQQPRIPHVGWKSRFRHYVGQKNAMQKLQRLLEANRFAPISEVLSHEVMSNVQLEEAYVAAS